MDRLRILTLIVVAFCFFVLGFFMGLMVAYPSHETWLGGGHGGSVGAVRGDNLIILGKDGKDGCGRGGDGGGVGNITGENNVIMTGKGGDAGPCQ